MEGEVWMVQQLPQAVFLQGYGIIGIQVVNADHPFPLVQQSLGYMKADETGCACKHVCHAIDRSKIAAFFPRAPMRLPRPVLSSLARWICVGTS